MATVIPSDIVELAAKVKDTMGAALFWAASYMIEAGESDNDAQIDMSRTTAVTHYEDAKRLCNAYFERVPSMVKEHEHMDALAHIAKTIHEGNLAHRESIERRFNPMRELDEWRNADLREYLAK